MGTDNKQTDPSNLTRRILFESAQWDHVARHEHEPEEEVGFFWQCDDPVCHMIAEHLNIAEEIEVDPDALFGVFEKWNEKMIRITDGEQARIITIRRRSKD